MAEQYGFALSFLKSDSSLWSLFNSAVKNNYTAQEFTAKLKTTSFYKKNSETARNYDLLRTTDPASYNAQLGQTEAQLRDAAGTMGAVVSTKTLKAISQNAMKYGWNDAQIRDQLGGMVKTTNGVYGGSTGEDIDSVMSTAYKNGVKISAATQQKWASQIASGNQTANFYEQTVRNMAKTLAPGFASQLQAGVDLSDIASPYVEAKAKILEQDPADIDLFDPDIRGALSGVDKDGKPSTTSLWQFEQQMRQKPQWLGTQNAQDSTMSVANKVLQDFGFSAESGSGVSSGV
jgi:hypothetical protein